MSGATQPAECWRIYQLEMQVRPHGAITRTFELVQGYTYMGLRRLLLRRAGKWEPYLYAHPSMVGRACALPNRVVISIKKHYHIQGIITSQWWHLHWPVYTEANPRARAIHLVHQIDTLKQARALIEEYVRNDYTVPEGACKL